MYSDDNIFLRDRYWTFLTALFTSSGPDFVLLSMLFLFRSRELERVLGVPRYLELVILSAILSAGIHFCLFHFISIIKEEWDVCYCLSWCITLVVITLLRAPLYFRVKMKKLIMNDKIPIWIFVLLAPTIRMQVQVAIGCGAGIILGLLISLLMALPIHPLSWAFVCCSRCKCCQKKIPLGENDNSSDNDGESTSSDQ